MHTYTHTYTRTPAYLRNHPDDGAERVLCDITYVLSVDQHTAFQCIVEAEEKATDGGFTGSCGSNDGGGGTGLHGEGYTFQTWTNEYVRTHVCIHASSDVCAHACVRNTECIIYLYMMPLHYTMIKQTPTPTLTKAQKQTQIQTAPHKKTQIHTQQTRETTRTFVGGLAGIVKADVFKLHLDSSSAVIQPNGVCADSILHIRLFRQNGTQVPHVDERLDDGVVDRPQPIQRREDRSNVPIDGHEIAHLFPCDKKCMDDRCIYRDVYADADGHMNVLCVRACINSCIQLAQRPIHFGSNFYVYGTYIPTRSHI